MKIKVVVNLLLDSPLMKKLSFSSQRFSASLISFYTERDTGIKLLVFVNRVYLVGAYSLAVTPYIHIHSSNC
jgi:hypothetical protein